MYQLDEPRPLQLSNQWFQEVVPGGGSRGARAVQNPQKYFDALLTRDGARDGARVLPGMCFSAPLPHSLC